MNKKRKILDTVLVSALATFATSASAAEVSAADVAALQRQIEALTQTVRDLQAQVTANQQAAEQRDARITEIEEATDNFDEVGGVPITGQDLETSLDVLRDNIDRRISAAQNATGVRLGGNAIVRHTLTNNGTSSFSIPTAGLNLSGSLRSDPVKDGDIGYRFSYVFSGTNANKTQDVYLTWGIRSRAKQGNEPFVTLDAIIGQQSVFFGNEVVSGEELRPTIGAAPWTGAFNSRDIGVVAKGGINWHYDASAPTGQEYIPTLAYEFGYFNGNGINADNNNNKATLAKFVYSPVTRYNHFFQGLKFGYSRLDWRNGPGDGVRNALNSVHAEWLKLPFLYTAEYVWGEQDTPAFSDLEGWQATIFYRPGKLPDFEPLIRYENYKPWGVPSATNADRQIATVGFNYYWYQVDPTLRRTYDTVAQNRVIKLQVNYQFIELSGNPLITERHPHQLLSQVVFNF